VDDHCKLTDLNEQLDGSFVAEIRNNIHLNFYLISILFS